MLSALPMTFDKTSHDSASAQVDENVQRVAISLERLQKNFIVSMREYMDSTASQPAPQANHDNVEAEVDDDKFSNEEELSQNDKMTDKDQNVKKKKKKNSLKKAPKVEDYDVDDPFIDDSEVGAVYESVFDLMMRGGEGVPEDVEEEEEYIEEGLEERDKSSAHSKRPLTMKDFYVYRGPIEVELVEKEFDEPKRKKKSKKTKKTTIKKPAEKDQAETVKVDTERGKKRKRKASSDESMDSNENSNPIEEDGAPNKKKKKDLSLTERLQQLEAELEEREGKGCEDINVADLDEDTKINGRKVYDIDKEVIRLEVLDAFEKIKETAAKQINFDPLRFPTALRAPLERYILTCLKRDNDMLEESALEQVAAIVPYSAQALRKLLLKKIFPLMIESLGQVRPEIIRTRIREEVNTILNSEQDHINPQSDGIEPVEPQTEPIEPTTGQNKKTKKRKWSDDLKQLVFEYLKCASERSLLLRAIRANASEPTPRPIPSSLSETALRRSAYRELLACWPDDKWTMTSAELSRECSNWKKRFERALLKEHGVDIEQFAVIVEKQQQVAATVVVAADVPIADVDETVNVVDSTPVH